jgi:hypothetical protein
MAAGLAGPDRDPGGRGRPAAGEGISNRPSGRILADQPRGRTRLGGFFQGLRKLGYIEGQNVVIERRFYGDSVERLPSLAAELARLPLDVIVTALLPRPKQQSALRRQFRSSWRITPIQSEVAS